MAALAYLFVECAPGRAWDVLVRLRRIRGIHEARVVTGPYDIIAVVEAADQGTIIEGILPKVLGIPGVEGTTTNLVIA
jgi:DNA-binding Lrp family transcriptional regulator